MSHTEEDFESSMKYLNKSKKDKLKKLLSLNDFIEDLSRMEPLVGLQYVVEIKIPGSSISVIKCNICCVKGHVKTMIEHLTGLQHIKAYMELYYFSELQSIRRSDNKIKVVTLIKDFAREIERAEGTRSVKIEYNSAADMKNDPDNWINEKNENYKLSNLKVECPFLDRRQMALQYSETFKISSRTEASVVLKLTQQLSDNLEQYFLKCKGLEILPYVCGTKDTCKNLGLESTLEKPVSKTEEPSFSSSTPKNACSVDGPRKILEPNAEEKQKLVIPSQPDDLQNNSDTGSQKTKRRKMEDPDQIPFISSLSVPHKYDSYQPTTLQVSLQSPSSSFPHYTEDMQSLAKSRSFVSDTCDYAPFGMEQNVAKNSFVSQMCSNTTTDVDIKSKGKPLSRIIEKKGLTDAGMKTKNFNLDVTFSHTSSHETPLCGQTQGKTSKTLSPDILQLLKGKDANTVTNILKTLSPFYPALQDVNLEILAQVLVNTGALD